MITSTTTSGVSEPRPAATVVLLREGVDGPELLLTIRPKHLRFMGGVAVFPGGTVAPADLDPAWARHCTVVPPAQEGAAGSGDDEAARGALVCAFREAFEEVGFIAGEGVERLERDGVDDPERFLRQCREREVVLATHLLEPAGNWVTPLGSTVRFDARFFLTEVPSGWQPDPDPGEVETCRWIRATDALEELATGTLAMAPPTVQMLQRIEGLSSVAEILETVPHHPLTSSGSTLAARLSPLVQVVLAPNPGLMTGPGTNSYVIGRERKIVIDPAVDDEGYMSALLEIAQPVERVLLTHRHPDHTGGVAEVVRATGSVVGAWGSESIEGVDVVPIEDGEVIGVDGVSLRAIHSPGHASDHLCFFLEEEKALFAGDVILGEGTSVIAPPEGDMTDYLETLDRLGGLYVARMYPGHFRPRDDGHELITAYKRHRMERERAIVDALATGPATVERIVEMVYVDTPPELHPVAHLSATAHLEKLSHEGRARLQDGRWHLGDVN